MEKEFDGKIYELVFDEDSLLPKGLACTGCAFNHDDTLCFEADWDCTNQNGLVWKLKSK